MKRHVRLFRVRAKGHDGSLKRAVVLLLMSLVAIVPVGWGIWAYAGAATSGSSQFCTSLRSEVKASQQLTSIMAGMSPPTLAKTKSQLLTVLNTILNSDSSVTVQLRSAPAKVQSSFRWDVLTEGRVKTALGQAATKRQIQTAMKGIDGPLSSHPREAPFIFYVLSQCESSASADVPADP
jgi:hypothetical protein